MPDNVDITVCTDCRSVLRGKRWLKQENIENTIKRFISESITTSKSLDIVDVDFNLEWEDDWNANANVRVVLKHDKIDGAKEFKTRVRLKRGICHACSRMHGNYYEAILQIRGKYDADRQKAIETYLSDRDMEKIVMKTIEKHGGVDIYITRAQTARKIASELASRFGCDLVSSAQLYGVKDGRKIYRMTYLVRFPEFTVGDYIAIEKYTVRVIDIRGQNVTVIDIVSGQCIRLNKKDMSTATVLGGNEIRKDAIVLSESQTEIVIMDPRTYKQVSIVKRAGWVREGETISVICIGDEIYLA